LLDLQPNPANDFVKVKLNSTSFSNDITNVELSVLDISGKVLIQQYEDDLNNASHIDISNLEPGYYLMKVTAEDGYVDTKKFLKQ